MENPALYAHWHAHFEDLQLSSKEFYDEIEKLIKDKSFPDVSSYRFEKHESSFYSAKREYLCVIRNDMRFYVCAAPFGKNFFVSHFLREVPSFFAQLMLWVPFVGRRWYEWAKRKTYYEIDSELIFKESVRRLVAKAIEAIGERRGARIEIAFESSAVLFTME